LDVANNSIANGIDSIATVNDVMVVLDIVNVSMVNNVEMQPAVT
jgi:metal-sulfur cluster biosynthetic enzyme